MFWRANEPESGRTWQTQTEGEEQTLVVELLKGVAPAYRLTVETERALEQLPSVVNAHIAHALDVKRETGLVALRSDEDIELAVEHTAEHDVRGRRNHDTNQQGADDESNDFAADVDFGGDIAVSDRSDRAEHQDRRGGCGALDCTVR